MSANEKRHSYRGGDQQLPRCRRSLECAQHEQSGGNEHRVERVLGHDRARVHTRRENDGQCCREERTPSLQDARRNEVHRDRSQREDDGVQPLGDRIGGGLVAAYPLCRREQSRVDHAVPRSGAASYDEVPRPGEAARQLPVDELVAEDARRSDRDRQQTVDDRRARHNGKELRPRAPLHAATTLRGTTCVHDCGVPTRRGLSHSGASPPVLPALRTDARRRVLP